MNTVKLKGILLIIGLCMVGGGIVLSFWTYCSLLHWPIETGKILALLQKNVTRDKSGSE